MIITDFKKDNFKTKIFEFFKSNLFINRIFISFILLFNILHSLTQLWFLHDFDNNLKCSIEINLYQIFANGLPKTEPEVQYAQVLPWFSDHWIYIFTLILVAILLYGIRRYEKNLQLIKFNTEKQAFMEGLFQNAPFAVASTDLEGRLKTINDVFEVTFEYSKSEIIGKKVDEFLLIDQQNDYKKVESPTELEEHQKVYKIGKRRAKSGKIIDVELFTTPNFVGGKQLGYLIFYNNISKRVQIKNELERTYTTYRQILDTLQDAYFEADPKGFINYCNNSLANALGYDNKHEIIGKHFRNFVSQKTIHTFLKNFRLLYNTKKPIEPFELNYITKDRKSFTSEIVTSPIIKDDEVVGARGIIRDISLRVKAEQMLREAKNAAEYRVDELTSINYVAEKISNSLNLEDILDAACRELTNVFPVKSASISLLNKEKNILEIMSFHTHNASEENLKGRILNINDNEYVKNMLKLKKTVIVENAQDDPRTIPIHEIAIKNDTKSFMIVPMINRGNLIGNIGMPANDPNYLFSTKEVELAETIASQIATAIENARLHTQTEIALDMVKHDLEIGKQIQSGFFPTSLPDIPGWNIFTYFKPARQVSGDFYDIFKIGSTQNYLLVVADICDKGVGAALFMVMLRSLIRSYSEQSNIVKGGKDLLYEISLKVNRYIVDTHGQSNMFATMILATFKSSSNNLFYINGGHETPIIINSNGQIKSVLEPSGPAFGFSNEIPFEIYKVNFSEGDSLIAYTDGLTEAKNSLGQFYSNERLFNRVKNKWDSAFSIIKSIEYDVLFHIGDHKQFDDITLVALQRKKKLEIECHSISESAELEKLPIFRNFITDTCKMLKISDEIQERLKLSVDEICSNIILYGYKGLEKGKISLIVRNLQNSIEVVIKDNGRPFDSSISKEQEFSDNIFERNIGGLGLYFVKETIDDISYARKDGFNFLTLAIRK